ncbi:hypothetical protein OV207_18490 [Corallococcus sp. BB11-1]|uniref:hypothetical protein n=1 Tax=Corallococcus sp. BB11-1 TaxID=2996783 RepID=UPI00226E2516|nr:hypothetical protein [Corallococcus sp. BB11-1]MCY1033448.1 hypothetical protein [Corallococcus sp. BB11-1]
MPNRLLLLLTVCVPLLASAKEPKPRTYDIIIVGGGKTEAEAQAALDGLKAKVPWARFATPSGDLLAVKKSDDYPGLNKGLYIAVLGMCARDAEVAEDMKRFMKALKAHAPGAYSKSIKGQYGDPCPPSSAFMPPDAEEKPLLERIAKEPKSADAYFAYGMYLKNESRLDEANAMVGQALELDPQHAEAKALGHLLMVLLTD